MTRFEFLYVLITFVTAFVVVDMATSWSALLRRRAVVRFYWVHVAWSVLIFLVVVQFWWGAWKLQAYEDWSFFSIAAICAELILLILPVSVITPSKHSDGPIDLQEFFYDNSAMFFSLCALLMIALALVNLVYADRPLLSMENVVRAIAISVAMYGATTRSTIVHTGLIVSGVALLVVFILLQAVR
jgi:hypothetical protein